MLKQIALWVNFSADILKYFSYFSMETGFDSLCKLSPIETICMKHQILFSGKKGIKSSIHCMLFAQRVVKVNVDKYEMS